MWSGLVIALPSQKLSFTNLFSHQKGSPNRKWVKQLFKNKKAKNWLVDKICKI